MPEFVLDIATRQIKRQFARAIGKNISKILTELVTNSDDSYRRLEESGGAGRVDLEDPASIVIVFDRSKKRFSVIDRAEGISDKEMEERFVTYGKESTDRFRGYKTRSLFGKGLRDVLFTQKNGQVRSIKDGLFYNCRCRWKDADGNERPVVDIKAPSRVTPELRAALRIPKNGTCVDFVLQEDVRSPQTEKLLEALSNFYMLRMINSSPHREVTLIVEGRGKAQPARQVNYRFPELEIKDRFEEKITTDLGTTVAVEGQIGIASHELSQGEVGYGERQGGLLVLDEDDAVLDLNLFGLDDDPAARRLSGLVKLVGAGAYIRAKLNQANPEEVLTETRDGFDKQHPFYRQLRELLYPRLEPIVAKLRELGPTPKLNLTEKTRARHQEAIDILNRLANEMLGKMARVPAVPAHKRIPPALGIAFANTHLSMQTGVATPVAILINTNMVKPGDPIDIASDNTKIAVQPDSMTLAEDEDGAGVAVKMVMLRSDTPDIRGKIFAVWKTVKAELDVLTTAREIITPINGLEFERDAYNVRLKARRTLRLFVDSELIPSGAAIAVAADDSAVRVVDTAKTVEAAHQVTANVAQVDIHVAGAEIRKEVVVTASYREYVAGTAVTVVKRERLEQGKTGLFKGYLFRPLERKVQTQWVPEGYIFINTRDPVNERYFGDDPGKAVEDKAYCQVRLADLVLNECLQIMVSQALESGRLDRKFPDNPEIDVRNYVDEKKFEIGTAIHDRFVTKA
jgi:hypothetical protein